MSLRAAASRPRPSCSALLLDCHDSFTWNVHGLLEAVGVSVRTVSIDALRPGPEGWSQDRTMSLVAAPGGPRPRPEPGRAPPDGLPDPERVPLLVLGPGPGQPRDYPELARLLECRLDRPVLGICLGMQAIACSCGGLLEGGAPVHGMIDHLWHDSGPEFRDVPLGAGAMRYHSLRVVRTGAGLAACARADDGTILAVRHEMRPWFGLQYHPESIGSEAGADVVRNLLTLWGIPLRAEVDP